MSRRPFTRSQARAPDTPPVPVPGAFHSTPKAAADDAQLSDHEESASDTASARSTSVTRHGLTYSAVISKHVVSAELHARKTACDGDISTNLNASDLTSLSSLLEDLSIQSSSNSNNENSPSPVPDDSRLDTIEGDQDWKEVRCRPRRSCSLDLPARRREPDSDRQDERDVIEQIQLHAIQADEEAREPVHSVRPGDNVPTARVTEDSETESHGEGTSTWQKGKTVDPRNWGATNIPQEELDPDVQRREFERYSQGYPPDPPDEETEGEVELTPEEMRRVLDEYKYQKARARHTESRIPDARDREDGSTGMGRATRRDKPPHVAPSPSETPSALGTQRRHVAELSEGQGAPRLSEFTQRHADSQPEHRARFSEHLEPASSLVNHVLNHQHGQLPETGASARGNDRPGIMRPATQVAANSYIGHMFANLRRRSSGPSNDGDGSEPSSEPDSSSSSESSSEDPDSASQARKRLKRKHSKKSTRSKKRKTPALKPKDPDSYSGTPDIQSFHKFLQQCTDYVDGCGLEPSRHASSLSAFMTGRAYEFYMVTVSQNPRTWNLERLFVELFNYCFPLDFRMRMREKLRKAYQKDKSVRKYVHELENLFLLAGVQSEMDRVERLWTGLNSYIQRGLWRERLTPTSSSWAAVVEAAEIIEISESVLDTSRRGLQGGSEQGGGGAPGPGGARGGRGTSGSSGGSKLKGGRGTAAARRPDGQRPPGTRKDSSNTPSRTRLGKPKDSAPKRQLSDREKTELQAAGKCYECKETGHFARNCPCAGRVRSDNPGQAPGRTNGPGVSSFSLEVGLTEREDLHQQSQDTEEGIDLQCISLASEPRSCSPDSHDFRDFVLTQPDEELQCAIHQRDWKWVAQLLASELNRYCGIWPVLPERQRARGYMPQGDYWERHASAVFERHLPYHCLKGIPFDDDLEPSGVVYRTLDGYAVLYLYAKDSLFVNSEWLRNERFDFPRWVAESVCHQLGTPYADIPSHASED
ncbi:hypothetical protein CERSUDRAFT_91037 [Gelatoporia subvermispora B]|uniref:CCHC-type domain-containing protein n=1 Tax=Ceriporiopsis subvermispora (strain B) TaxID=914234 RepID=M2RN74_CERS8|nr:hypothetical protein CERSUDRAFT_91037 [Gelatoporia subvermispora B]